jgi:hypothetical protein
LTADVRSIAGSDHGSAAHVQHVAAAGAAMFQAQY